jgi:threonine synthase
VPTGNFGNILAAYYAMQMGLPVNRFICASNDNNVFTEFINTGTYNKNREFIKTISPSMDILISSNLERLLYDISGRNSELISGLMAKLNIDGYYSIDADMKRKMSGVFWAGYSTEAETLKTIEYIYKENNYLTDPHTAVAIDVYDKYVISTGDIRKTVIVSTASPFKFNESVAEAVFGSDFIKDKNEFQLLQILSEKSGMPVPKGLRGLDNKPFLHKKVCARQDMKGQVMEVLGIEE